VCPTFEPGKSTARHPQSASSSVKLTPGRTGKGGHHEYTQAFPLGVHEDRVFPIKLGAGCLRKKENMVTKKIL
jgi:hypothetical protein